MREHVLPAPIALLSHPNEISQLRAGGVCDKSRGLGADMDTRLVAIELDAIDPLLLKLAQSPDVEIHMEALACLCNLSLSGCIGDNPLSCIDAVSGCATPRQYCSFVRLSV